MVQLKVYKDEAAVTDTTYANQWFLDLYETEPIKLNLSVEDITNADAQSVYSRTFKVPATRHNEEFFQNAYEVDGVDFDITVKKPATILVDGSEFKQGHIRLQKIFVNRDKNTIEYELLFLGETRDFASRLGEKRMCELVFRNSNGDLDLMPSGPTFNKTEIAQSWQAYPEGGLNDGLYNGDILFPLVDHGNTYDDSGTPLQAVIGYGSGSQKYFNHQPGLSTNQMKPMFRAKRVFDQIFEDAGYEYDSEFLNSNKFRKIYVSAFGNQASPVIEPDTVNEFTGWCSDTDEQGVGQKLLINEAENDPSNSFNTVGGANGWTTYTAGAITNFGATPPIVHQMYAECFYNGYFETSDGQTQRVDARLVLKRNGTVVATSNWGNNRTLALSYTTNATYGDDQQGDTFTLEVEPYYVLDYDLVENCYWEVSKSPGSTYLPKMFDCEYKQVDFIKDILTAFRLVMEPDPNNKLKFLIEPWQEYIGSGDLHDWSKKLVEDKDQVLEPLFNTQSRDIDFDFKQDEDWTNKFHFDNYKQIYGHLEFTSNNDLLKGTRKIEFIGLAPTIMLQPEAKNADESQFIIPQLHIHEAEDGQVYHSPIKPKTRLLFYNGINPIGPDTYTWYLDGTGYTTYPQVSPYESFPFLDTSGSTTPLLDPNLNISWSNDIKYFVPVTETGIPAGLGYNDLNGYTLYDAYWNRYISSLYNKYSRRLTAYFILDNTDLQYLSFDDIIFVNGKYWRPEKIMDAQIGRKTAVKCQLISLKDYRPGYTEESLDNFALAHVDQLCAGACDGIITVTTSGTPPFTWDLGNGQTGTHTAPIGQGTYQFDIENVCPGIYTVQVEDSVGRTGSGGVIIDPSTASPLYTNHTVTDATDCEAPCNGSIQVIAGGGTPPLTIEWDDDPTTNFNRNGLCPGSYTYTVTDANGCTSGASILLSCNAAPTRYELRQFLDQGCASLGTTPYVVETTATLNVGDVYGLATLRGGAIPGCFQVIGTTQLEDAFILDVGYSDCEACQNSQTTPTPTPTATPTATPTPTPTPTPSLQTVYKVEQINTADCGTDPTEFRYIPYDPTITNFGPWIIAPTGSTRTEFGCWYITQSVINETPTHSLVYSPPDCAGCPMPETP